MQLKRTLTIDDFTSKRAKARYYALTKRALYRGIIEQILNEGGIGGVVTLDDNEDPTVEKRRLSIAAGHFDRVIDWEPTNDPDVLQFFMTLIDDVEVRLPAPVQPAQIGAYRKVG